MVGQRYTHAGSEMLLCFFEVNACSPFVETVSSVLLVTRKPLDEPLQRLLKWDGIGNANAEPGSTALGKPERSCAESTAHESNMLFAKKEGLDLDASTSQRFEMELFILANFPYVSGRRVIDKVFQWITVHGCCHLLASRNTLYLLVAISGLQDVHEQCRFRDAAFWLGSMMRSAILTKRVETLAASVYLVVPFSRSVGIRVLSESPGLSHKNTRLKQKLVEREAILLCLWTNSSCANFLAHSTPERLPHSSI
jgi:hypothetical protein